MSALREAVIDLGAIAGNLGVLRAAVGVPAMFVVKAEGYGHGAVEAARAGLAGGADWLGVTDIAEAMQLRAAGIAAPLLSWLHGPDADFAEAIDADVELGLSSLAQLDAAASAGHPRVHLKLDTGLGRNGAAEPEWPALFSRTAELQRQGRLSLRGIFSHLALAGEAADAAQHDAFERGLALAAEAGLRAELRHLAASDAALRLPHLRYDLVRIGIAGYGVSPFDDRSAAELGLRPAMELSAQIIAVKRVPAGTGISYGHRAVTDRETTLALVPIGYADGAPRTASGAGPVSINGVIRAQSGTIAMDQLVVDVGDADVAVGDRAVLWGDPATGAPSAGDWASAAGTIGYEIVTRIGPRVQRRYLS